VLHPGTPRLDAQQLRIYIEGKKKWDWHGSCTLLWAGL